MRRTMSCPLLDFTQLDLGDLKWFLLQQASSPPKRNAVLKCGDVLGFATENATKPPSSLDIDRSTLAS